MTTTHIFISYRRDDSAGYARAISDALAREFGADRVFIDVDDIGAGQPFADVIGQAVAACSVLLVLIGRRWQPERLAADGDFVRLEIDAALRAGVRLIPLLLDGAAMPSAAELPPSIAALTGRNAVVIDNRRSADDIARLVAALRSDAPGVAAPKQRRIAVAAAAGAVVLAAAGAALLLLRPAAPPPAFDFAGSWTAQVRYDWPGADFAERMTLTVAADGGVGGSASFLRVPRAIVAGRIDADGAGLRFSTRSTEIGANGSVETEHAYAGRADGPDTIHFTMLTSGGSAHDTIAFTATRASR